jgi:LPS export ABC transporter protein LptC
MKSFKKLIDRFQKLDKIKKSYVIALLLIILVMGWAFISAGVITSNFNRNQVKNSVNDEKVNALGIIITETKNGTKYFEIYGENGNYGNDTGVATLNNVVGNFYKNNEVSMSFQSSKGAYDEKNHTITLYENTYIVLKDETSLNSDRLIWSGSNNDTIAEGNVKIKKGSDMIATADKCVISSGYDKFKIIGKSQTKIFGK